MLIRGSAVYDKADSVASTTRKSFLSLPEAQLSLFYRRRSDFEAFSPAHKHIERFAADTQAIEAEPEFAGRGHHSKLGNASL